jgi:hypothetical protein
MAYLIQRGLLCHGCCLRYFDVTCSQATGRPGTVSAARESVVAVAPLKGRVRRPGAAVRGALEGVVLQALGKRLREP